MARGEMKPQQDIVRSSAHSGLPLSPYVKAGDTIYVSGTVGRDPDSGVIEKDNLGAQTHMALRIVEVLLRQASACLADVIKVTIYLTDMDGFTDVNRAYRTVFGADLPARTCVAVSSLPDPEAQVEIDVVAYRRSA